MKNQKILIELLSNIEQKERTALTTIIEAEESKLIGSKSLIKNDEQQFSDMLTNILNDDQLDKLIDSSLQVLSQGTMQSDELEFSENGQDVEIVVEPYYPNPRLIILGGGHVGQNLYQLAKELDFKIAVVDDRPSFANQHLFPSAEEVICAGFKDALTELKITESDYIVIATRGHQHDFTCLQQVLNSEVAYIGMLGSKRRVYSIFNRLKEVGYSEEEIDKVKAPIGLDIGSETPAEIGVSILAEIIKVRRTVVQQNNIAGEEAIRFLANYQGDYDTLALATIIKTSGSTPRKAGSKMVILPDGQIKGTIGGG